MIMPNVKILYGSLLAALIFFGPSQWAQAQLAPLNSFVLPGGKPAAAHLHMARTIVRRAEREMTLLAERETVSATAIRYANRLSDHLFVAARFANDLGAKDVLWQPGATRSL